METHESAESMKIEYMLDTDYLDKTYPAGWDLTEFSQFSVNLTRMDQDDIPSGISEKLHSQSNQFNFSEKQSHYEDPGFSGFWHDCDFE